MEASFCLIDRPSLKSSLHIFIPTSIFIRIMLTKSYDEISNNAQHTVFALFITMLCVVSSDIIFFKNKIYYNVYYVCIKMVQL